MIENLEQTAHIERFGKVFTGALIQQGFDLCGGGIGADDDDGNIACDGGVLQLSQHLRAMNI